MTSASSGFAAAYNSKGQATSMTSLTGTNATAMGYAGTNQFERFTAGAATYTNNALGIGAETSASATTYYRRDNEGGLVSERLPTTGNPVYYYAFDGLGSVAAMTDSSGAAPQRYDYDPYGETTLSPSTPAVPNPFRYASSYQDPTGFYKMGMRYYSPTLMRWSQTDPQEQPTDPTQAMRFGYAGGDPVNFTDPSGMLKRAGCTANISADACRRQRARSASRAARTQHVIPSAAAWVGCTLASGAALRAGSGVAASVYVVCTVASGATLNH
jgi:RHS repeat-associated protein